MPFYASAEEAPIRIGVIQSLTGMAAQDGNSILQGIKLAVEDEDIHLKVEDDASEAKNTVTAFRKLKHSGVDLIIAGTWSLFAHPVKQFAEREKTVVVTTSNFPEMFGVGPAQDAYFYSATSSVAGERKPFEELYEKKKPKNVFLMYVETPWGQTLQKSFSDFLIKKGVSIESEGVEIVGNDEIWGTLVPKIRSKEPDLILLLLDHRAIGLFLKSAQQIKYTPTVFASTHLYQSFLDSNNKSMYEGVCFTYPYKNLNTENEFSTRFKKTYNSRPRLYSDSSYFATRMLVKAVRDARKLHQPLNHFLSTASMQFGDTSLKYSPKQSLSGGENSLLCVSGGEIMLQD